ncbi:MBL fold metallo-hydrolase [Candidatus Woesearchaeota archaeon]|jgi:putative mRNA 3-end processing factor|nr:MBL fold metallo-hydrolase [Candidatus Woesearchaeota archaeon]
MKLTFHGGANEVGRSCVELVSDNTTIFFDAGLKLSEKGTDYPVNFSNLDKVDAVLLSHAHLDHCGALPFLDHNGLKCPVFCTKTTKNLTRLLLKDAFKVGKILHTHLGYDKPDIYKALDFMKRIKLKEKETIKDIEFEFLNAGHIPGSASILVKTNHPEYKTILYTGDVQTSNTHLLNFANIELDHVDILICETTYGDRNHPNRLSEEKRFISAIEDTILRGGSAIVPVFAIGRAQEIIMLLSEHKFGVPIFIDGMAKSATEIMLSDPNSVKNHSKLRDAYQSATKANYKSRESITHRRGIFVTTSGMLTGGAVMAYLRKKYKNKRDSILLTGYQAEGTNGHLLLDTGHMYIEGHRKKVDCEVFQFDFSAHCGQSELKQLIRQLSPKKLILVHGDPNALTNISEWARVKDIDVHVPDVGDIIKL